MRHSLDRYHYLIHGLSSTYDAGQNESVYQQMVAVSAFSRSDATGSIFLIANSRFQGSKKKCAQACAISAATPSSAWGLCSSAAKPTR
jgi:hypothetical protein